MRKSHFTEEQIMGVLKELEAGNGDGGSVSGAWRQSADLLSIEAKYGGLEVSEARRLHELEEENRQLKHALAEAMLDVRVLKAVLSKSSWPAGSA